MLTWILMLINKIPTANTVIIILGAAWLIYLLLFAVVKANRGKRQFASAFIFGIIATICCDAVWFFKFFDNLTYLNPGIEAYFWLCIIFAALLLLVMVESYINVAAFQHREKRRKKEEEKERKKQNLQKPAEKPAEATAEKPAEATEEKPAEKPAEEPSEKPAEEKEI